MHFDAFLCDHQEDPFIALVEELYSQADSEEPAETRELLKRFRAAAVAIVRELGLTALDRVHPTLGIVARAGADAVAVDTSEPTDPLDTWLEHARTRKQVIGDFRDHLTQLARHCADVARDSAFADAGELDVSDSPTKTGLVVIIDELDRCRPAFAVRMLERVKHLFGAPGVSFVLVVNLTELEHSVKMAYGDVDAQRYLEKFYDLVVQLDVVGVRDKRKRYFSYLEQEIVGASSGDHSRAELAKEVFELLHRPASNAEFSLRTAEHVVRYAMLLLQAQINVASEVIAFSSVLNVWDPALSRKLARGQSELLEDRERERLTRLWNSLETGENGESVLANLRPNHGVSEAARLLAHLRIG